MPFKLTHRQEEAIDLFGTEATFVLLYGGARSTKTFTILRNIVQRALVASNSRHAVLRFRFNHVKSSVIYDTFPKVMELCFPDTHYKLDKSDWFARFDNGSEIWFGGLDDKERTEKILGNEYCTIFLNEASQISYSSFLILITRLAQKAKYTLEGKEYDMRLRIFIDENPPSKGHWTYKMFIKGINPDNKEQLKNPNDYVCMRMNPADNLDNLPAVYLEQLENLPRIQRERFLYGKFADETANALWTEGIIEKSRVSETPDLLRVVVAVDPSGASSDDSENSDAIGICVAGLGKDGCGYLIEDLTVLDGPAKWGKITADAYERHKADRVIGEANYGGGMVEYTIKTANPNISYKSVHASRGKVVRAEPISALHETGKIKLVGEFPDLEDELLAFSTAGYTGDRSPNRADAFIWAMTELFPGMAQRASKKDYGPPIELRRF